MLIETLKLNGQALEGAKTLFAKHPFVVFTSGFRTAAEQAEAMATNVIQSQDSEWIAKTYAPSKIRDALQANVRGFVGNVEQTRKELIQDLTLIFTRTMLAFPDKERGHISKHLAGLAFDISPITAEPRASHVRYSIQHLPGLTKFLEHEGGLLRWHVQF